jgi:glycosyltransferase involved in cell wall biosynthesis
MPTRSILLLQENTAVGGIHTITQALADALRRAGHAPAALAVRGTPLRALLHAARQADLIVATNGFLPAYAAWLLGRLLRKPMVAWLHGPTQEVLEQAQASAAKRAWLRWLYRRLRWVVFVSSHARDSFLGFTGGATAGQRLAVIPNAHPAWQPVPVNAPPQHLGFVGRLAPEKQPELLVQALRLLPATYRLCLVGDGPSQPALRAASTDLQQAGRLALRPFQPVDAALYAPWQATVLASRYEGCPMAALESLAAGVPCVGLPIPALREMLEPDMPYALARECSAPALAQAVQTVCAMPRGPLAHDMARVLRRYSPERFAQGWLRVLQEAAAC